MEYQPNLNEKYTTLLHCISSFEGIYFLLDIYSTSSFIYFFLFYISFYISRYHFVQRFRTSINIEDMEVSRTIEEMASGISRCQKQHGISMFQGWIMKNFLDPVKFPGVLVLGFKSSKRCNTFNLVEFLGVKLCFIFLGFPGVK